MTTEKNLELGENDLAIDSLGQAKIPSPLLGFNSSGPESASHWDSFTEDDSRILVNVSTKSLGENYTCGRDPASFEEAGARRAIYFDSSKVRAAILTAGGLCPGLNDVIRALVMTLHYRYGVHNILGVKYGYQGLLPEYGHELIPLEAKKVSHIHEFGGTILGSSRGGMLSEDMVDSLERLNINLLFCIGGDGTLKGAHSIAQEVKKRGLKLSVVGIPKTIDNDIGMVARSFGFETAVAIASDVIRSAHTEAIGAPHGVGLVKLMGRDSGFIAATAALAQSDANYVLIPEIDFDLDGPGGLLAHLEKRLENRGHAVIVVAEGAGQKYFETQGEQKDASGNILHKDIGMFLADQIKAHFKTLKKEINLKYIDPSYIIRSAPANASDQVYCSFLGQKAVHAAMAGKTDLLIGQWNDHFVHVPIALAIRERKKVDPHGVLWTSVLEGTGQPNLSNNNRII
ncbi:diphosphate--fructose-6-phosphate 1-phosphotransferase [Deltaproteobacteria bacterium Smac51]|nr:diphosphate--fructose-6-phosphate 1-phosphotransferase [Deltaproteobacteria bacterium Smac51]